MPTHTNDCLRKQQAAWKKMTKKQRDAKIKADREADETVKLLIKEFGGHEIVKPCKCQPQPPKYAEGTRLYQSKVLYANKEKEINQEQKVRADA